MKILGNLSKLADGKAIDLKTVDMKNITAGKSSGKTGKGRFKSLVGAIHGKMPIKSQNQGISKRFLGQNDGHRENNKVA